MNKSVLALALSTGVSGIALRKVSKVAASDLDCNGVITNFEAMMTGYTPGQAYTPVQHAAYEYLCNQHRTETGKCLAAGAESGNLTVIGKSALGWGTMCNICPAAEKDAAWKCEKVPKCKNPSIYTCDNADDAGGCLLAGWTAANHMEDGTVKDTLLAALHKGTDTMCQCEDLPHKSEWQCPK